MPRTALWTVLSLAPPGSPPEAAGVLLGDPIANEVHSRFRRDLSEIDPDSADILEALEPDLEAKAQELGFQNSLDWFEENASNYFRVSDREQIQVEDLRSALNFLYHRHIRPKVLPFRTHLPVFSLQAAAGRWGPSGDVESSPEEWMEAPEGLRLNEDMFVARVVGRSMEPRVPAGSLCVFRAGSAVAGTRQGKLVLVANYGEPGEQRFTIKKYESTARPGAEGRRIVLHPLNPEFEAWEIDPRENDRVAVIAEFVCLFEES